MAGLDQDCLAGSENVIIRNDSLLVVQEELLCSLVLTNFFKKITFMTRNEDCFAQE